MNYQLLVLNFALAIDIVIVIVIVIEVACSRFQVSRWA
jgi:hypothetical protein